VDLYRVLERPIITEKSNDLSQATPNKPRMTNPEWRRYTFQVALKANKTEIKQAVEQRYGVRVAAVNTMTMKPKEKGVGARRGRDLHQPAREVDAPVVIHAGFRDDEARMAGADRGTRRIRKTGGVAETWDAGAVSEARKRTALRNRP